MQLEDIKNKLMIFGSPLHWAPVGRAGLEKDDDYLQGRQKNRRPVRSREEIARAIRTLTPAQRRKLSKVAHIYGGSHIEPGDLLQSAFHAALEDGSDREQRWRLCPCDTDIVTFLCGVMRSISHGEREKQKTRGVHVAIDMRHGQERKALDLPDPASDDPAEAPDIDALYNHIMSLFERDPQATQILRGIANEVDAKELPRQSGLSKVSYQTKRRQIRRTIDRAYPRGLRRG
jgi:hypothetical protein